MQFVIVASIMSMSPKEESCRSSEFLRLTSLSFWITIALYISSAAGVCDKYKCKGPVLYYEELKCKPIYANPGDCCAVSYDCSHLKQRSKNKCYFNGHTYENSESLKKVDQIRGCNGGCFCSTSFELGAFICPTGGCYPFPQKPGCFTSSDNENCCGHTICPEDLVNATKCEVEGKSYWEGEGFYPKANPDLLCTCKPGYKGKNVEPFCTKLHCNYELRHRKEIESDCFPVFYQSSNPTADCGYNFRCQNARDKVISKSRNRPAVPGNGVCKLGSLVMQVGDELNQGTDYSSSCVKCVCEVPPTATCLQLPDEECTSRYNA